MSNRIKELREAKGLSQAALAQLASTSNQQISMLERGERTLSPRWLRRLADAFGVPAKDLLDDPGDEAALLARATDRATGLREPDISPYIARETEHDQIDRICEILYPGHRNATVWQINNRALELAGFIPGDLAIVDLDRTTPAAGDAICAQVYDWNRADAKTVLRIYEPPYLIAASNDARFRKPELVDNDRVIIKGTIVASFRRSD